ncbi:DUF6185 family protein [Streptomyces zaomyceticus]|uniref:DUF6185 family protein n=1 Tax=Streptomyces zaomyceticus TaxID=68286 RepID=UPI003426E0AB
MSVCQMRYYSLQFACLVAQIIAMISIWKFLADPDAAPEPRVRRAENSPPNAAPVGRSARRRSSFLPAVLPGGASGPLLGCSHRHRAPPKRSGRPPAASLEPVSSGERRPAPAPSWPRIRFPFDRRAS